MLYSPNSQTLKSTVAQIKQGLEAGLKPKLTEEGTSGTYLLRGTESAKPLAVFKPIDEE